MLKIDREKCNGCVHLKEGSRCVAICHGDLLYLDKENRSTIYDNSECWDCFSCVKACPRRALSIQLPFQINESQTCLKGYHKGEETVWKIESPDGKPIQSFSVHSYNPPAE